MFSGSISWCLEFELVLRPYSRNFKFADYNAIKNNVDGIDCHSEFQTLDTNESLQKFYSILYDLFDKYVGTTQFLKILLSELVLKINK